MICAETEREWAARGMAIPTLRFLWLAGFCLAWCSSPALGEVDSRIWSQAYWAQQAQQGLVPFNPPVTVKTGVFVGTSIEELAVDSPDVAITNDPSVHQSETSVFVHPGNPNSVLNSNNSSDWPVTTFFGTSAYVSSDTGVSWSGFKLLPSGVNNGDPAAVIDLSGRYYIGGIETGNGQEVNISTDGGTTWVKVSLPISAGVFFADKNHLWADNSPSSLHAGILYSAWTAFGGANDGEIELDRSTDGGLTWSGPTVISAAVVAGAHNQGVNLQTGPSGEVYAVWIIYDSWPSDETAIGFARSLDGGVTWQAAQRILSNIRGIRTTQTSKNHRVNSFPVMAVDISSSVNAGTIYVTWTNIGVPGVNVGPDIDVYLIRSIDSGVTWSAPTRVNQDPAGLGNEHYTQWITCDPITGDLSMVFYDDRNVASTNVEVFVASSTDGGVSWIDFRVSDSSFTPTPVPGLANGYFGDYNGISARAGRVYPVWTGNPTGQPLAYTSPFFVPLLDVWVDFAYSGTESGTFQQPYDTLAEGLAVVASGGRILIKAGSGSETPSINQSVTLEAPTGSVTIGN